jgi:hypothetical protein
MGSKDTLIGENVAITIGSQDQNKIGLLCYCCMVK